MSRRMRDLRIRCDGESHPTKRSDIGQIKWTHGEGLIGMHIVHGSVLLIDDQPIDAAQLKVDAALAEAFAERGRSRHDWACKVCGFHQEYREEAIAAMVARLETSTSVPWKVSSKPPDTPWTFEVVSLTFSELVAILEK